MRNWGWNVAKIAESLNSQYSDEDIDDISQLELAELHDMIIHLDDFDDDSNLYNSDTLQNMLQAVLERWKEIIIRE